MTKETAKPATDKSELSEEQLESVTGGSDLGQQLQLALQEANNIFTRIGKVSSNVQQKGQATADGIANKIKP